MYYDEIIAQRQAELFDEINKLEQQIEELQILKERRQAEYEMLNSIQDVGLKIQHDAQHQSRIDLEEAIKRIFERAGRPIKIGELIKELERYGYKWSRYQNAYQYLKNVDILQPAGSHGYYQILRY